MTDLDREIEAIESPAREASASIRSWLRDRIVHVIEFEPPAPKAKHQPNPAYEAPPPVVYKPKPSPRPKGTSMSEQQAAREIHARLVAGETAEQVAASLQIARRSVYNKLYRVGLEIPSNKCETCGKDSGRGRHCADCYPDYKRSQMRKAYAEGKK